MVGMGGHKKPAAKRLTSVDRRRLQRALSATGGARVYRRLEAVLLVAEGHSISEAARRVRAARLSVQRWAARYLTSHDAGVLADRSRRGRPRVAPSLTRSRLTAALARDPRACGYRATSWTVPLLAQHLRERHGIPIGGRTLRRRLREAGCRWKRPRYVYAGRAARLAQKKGP